MDEKAAPGERPSRPLTLICPPACSGGQLWFDRPLRANLKIKNFSSESLFFFGGFLIYLHTHMIFLILTQEGCSLNTWRKAAIDIDVAAVEN
jgi:hypothetical protein